LVGYEDGIKIPSLGNKNKKDDLELYCIFWRMGNNRVHKLFFRNLRESTADLTPFPILPCNAQASASLIR
jgi:hypothetical protein